VTGWDRLVEDRIRRAQERGEFDRLPGRGKPLRLPEENPFEGTWRLAFHLLKNAGCLPSWLEQDREARASRLDTLSALRRAKTDAGGASAEWEKRRLRARVERTNALICARNANAPEGMGSLVPLRFEDDIRR
jgi:hypothetical protein